jgi:hypothetical protein
MIVDMWSTGDLFTHKAFEGAIFEVKKLQFGDGERPILVAVDSRGRELHFWASECIRFDKRPSGSLITW